MYEAKYIREGDTIEVAESVVAGAVKVLGDIIGIAKNDADEVAVYSIVGVFEMPLLNTVAVNAGDVMYWDDTAKNITDDATGNTKAGIAMQSVTAGAETIEIKIG